MQAFQQQHRLKERKEILSTEVVEMEHEEWTVFARRLTDPNSAGKKPEALERVRVLDLSSGSFAGLFASSLLAEFGAEVIRVEPPGGDVARKISPENLRIGDTGIAYIVEGRNKYHITLNIKTEKGQNILKRLVEKSDVLIETFSPGFMESLGLGYNELSSINRQLIYCALHSHGHRGERSEKAKKAGFGDYDIIAQAMSGFAYTTGISEEYEEFPEHTRVPTRMGNWMGWYAGGAFAALAIMAALIFRDFSMEGQYIDISPAEALMCLNNYALHFYHLTGRVIERSGNFEPAAYAYNYFRAKDGMVFIAGYTDPNWRALCRIIGRDDLSEKYPTIKDRTNPENWIPMTREIEKFTMQHTREEILKLWLSFKGEGVTVAGEVLKPIETIKFNHWYERGALLRFRDRDYGEILIQGTPAKMSETPPRVKWVCRAIGADNLYVYSKLLNIDVKELDELKRSGVV